MKNLSLRVVEFAKSRPLIFGLGVLLLAPGFIFGVLFDVLGFIGWGRIFLAILIVAGYAGYKYVRSEMNYYKDNVDDIVDTARSLKDDLWR